MNSKKAMLTFKRIAISCSILASAVFITQLQLGLLNIGQEFGTYGQYNRVLHLIDEMDELTVLHSRLNRDLELGHLSHLNNFSVTVRDTNGKESEISFVNGSVEFTENDKPRLRQIIRKKAGI